MHLGHCFVARRNWALGRRNYEEALRNIPAEEEDARKEVLYHLALGHADAGDLSRAIELGQELTRLDPTYLDVGSRIEEWQARPAGRPPVKRTGK